ncbi:hypothetical protein GQX74_012423 [Glossina fuscipes]|nr:hypothetical protein GQX74_012423 [Glossina fuscipes]
MQDISYYPEFGSNRIKFIFVSLRLKGFFRLNKNKKHSKNGSPHSNKEMSFDYQISVSHDTRKSVMNSIKELKEELVYCHHQRGGYLIKFNAIQKVSDCALTMSTDRSCVPTHQSNHYTHMRQIRILILMRGSSISPVDLPCVRTPRTLASKAENTKKLLQIDSDSNDNNPDEEAMQDLSDVVNFVRVLSEPLNQSDITQRTYCLKSTIN